MSAHVQQEAALQELVKLPEAPIKRPGFEIQIVDTDGYGLRLSVVCDKFADVEFSRIISSPVMSDHEKEEARHVVRRETESQARLLDKLEKLSKDITSIHVKPVGLHSRMLIRFRQDDRSEIAWIEIAEDVVRHTVKNTRLGETHPFAALMTFVDFRILSSPVILVTRDE